MEFLIYLALWILGGAIIFRLYYFFYRRTLKNKSFIQSSSFIVKAPLIIGCSNVLLGLILFILFYALSQGYSLRLTTIFFTILTCYIFLGISILIGSISIIFYKKKLVTNKRFVPVVLMNAICIILSIISFDILSSSTTCDIKVGYSIEDYLIYLACYILGGAIIFGLYYLLYKRTLKKKGFIQSSSFIIKAPIIIGRINILLFVVQCILMYLGDSQGALPLFFIRFIVVIIIIYLLILSVPLSIASIATAFVFYKEKLLTKDKLLGMVFTNSILVVIMLVYIYLLLFTSLFLI